jgi:hypothetical protein
MRNVLCRYGACAEVVTDQGAEFQNEFPQMLRTAFIDHLHCLEPPLSEVPEESPWCCPDCHQQGITPAILDTLLRQNLQQQGLNRPVLMDQREIMEDKVRLLA